DVVGRQDDRHATRLQRAHERPHVAPQLDVDAGGRLVEKQDRWLVRKRLRDEQPALHAAGQRHDLAVLLVPQRQVPQYRLYVRRMSRSMPFSARKPEAKVLESFETEMIVPAASASMANPPLSLWLICCIALIRSKHYDLRAVTSIRKRATMVQCSNLGEDHHGS